MSARFRSGPAAEPRCIFFEHRPPGMGYGRLKELLGLIEERLGR